MNNKLLLLPHYYLTLKLVMSYSESKGTPFTNQEKTSFCLLPCFCMLYSSVLILGIYFWILIFFSLSLFLTTVDPVRMCLYKSRPQQRPVDWDRLIDVTASAAVARTFHHPVEAEALVHPAGHGIAQRGLIV